MSVEAIIEAVAAGSRVLAQHGVLDAFGHVSARNPERPDRFFMPRSMAPALVTPGDVLELDLAAEPVSDPDARVFLERFIHSEIYLARPDVVAIVHSHAVAVVPFSAVPSVRLRPICHVCGFLAGVGQAFDIADHAGPSSDLLVRDAGLGSHLAAHLGEASVTLMRGHGFTCVGRSVEEAVFRAFYTVRNCEIQITAMGLGEPIYLTEGEMEACDETTAGQVGRAWGLWMCELGGGR